MIQARIERRNATNQREFILPSSFDPIELLPPKLHKFADDARCIASMIIRKTARGQAHDDGYVPLRAEYLRSIISERNQKEILFSALTATVS